MDTKKSIITWNGRKITDPKKKRMIIAGVSLTVAILLALLLPLVVGTIGVLVTVFVVVIIMLLASTALAFPTHFLLKALGRRRFVKKAKGGELEIEISSDGFKKA